MAIIIIRKDGKMSKKFNVFLSLNFLMFVLALIANQSLGEIPKKINYQGILTDPATGDPLPDGDYNITFSIYDDLTAGNLKWSENDKVNLSNGLFNKLLGEVSVLDLNFTIPYYMEIKVEDEILSPRLPMTSVGTAINADLLDGHHFNEVKDRMDNIWSESCGKTISCSGIWLKASGTGIGATLQVTGGDPAIYGSGTYVGIEGRGGSYGVYGSSSEGYGVIGIARYNGIYGSASQLNGVVGQASKYGVYGLANYSYGVYGSASILGGVYGEASTYGVFGSADSYGVYGSAYYSYGVYGKASTYGVYGKASTYGVFGSAAYCGVYGSALSAYGVIGVAPSYAVYGFASGVLGVIGEASSFAVYGHASDIGVFGSAYSSGVYGKAWTHGVYGWASFAYGVRGDAPSFGVYGSAEVYGVYGSVLVSYGVYGIAKSYGVCGSASSAYGVSGNAPRYGVYGEASSYGVYGSASIQYGVRGSAPSFGVYGQANVLGVYGEATSCGVYGNANYYGVFGYATSYGVYGSATSGIAVAAKGNATGAYNPALWAENINSNGIAAHFQNTDPSATGVVFLISQKGSGDIVRFDTYNTGWNPRFKIDNVGNVTRDGSCSSPCNDYADYMTVVGDKSQYQPGDVLVLSKISKSVELSTEAYSTNIAGVYSTQPNIIGGAPEPEEDPIPKDKIPVALVGMVPCKVTAANGAIQPGDLLTSSNIPGHAMKAIEKDIRYGSIVGKAMEGWENGEGVIQILVHLQ